MDILRQEVKKHPLRRYGWKVAAAGGLISLLIVMLSYASADYVVKREQVTVAEVQNGEFLVQVRGIGVLTPKNIQFLGANVEGGVERIELEAGAAVKKGDVIAQIANPKLKEQLQETKWELEAIKKEYDASEASLRADLANLRTEAKNAVFNYDSAKLKLNAEKGLVESGIVSKLTYEQTKLNVSQEKERIQSADERVKMMEVRLRAEIDAHAARIQKMNNTLNLIQQQVDDLQVRSPIEGVVQQMAIKLGQQVVSGTEIARIAPHDSLVAMLDVQDYQVRDIRLGQPVNIDTRGNVIRGKVSRIDPAVTNGIVKVEVALEGEIPPDARPDQSIEGVIDIDRKEQTLFVTRPPLAKSHGKAAIFRLDGNVAVRTVVDFGLVSTRSIEVVSGLKAGDRIIVSDASAWESHEKILLK